MIPRNGLSLQELDNGKVKHDVRVMQSNTHSIVRKWRFLSKQYFHFLPRLIWSERFPHTMLSSADQESRIAGRSYHL